jgi:hypothetical protein
MVLSRRAAIKGALVTTIAPPRAPAPYGYA